MSHFTNIKVKGVEDESGRKNYIITNTDDGSEHVAIKRESGSKYDIGEHNCLTLRQCKQLVSDNRVKHFADRCTKIVQDNIVDDLAGALSDKTDKTWDCCDPCALLILHAGSVDDPEVKRTLDAYGWLLPDGTLDVEQAEENLEKWGLR